VKNLRFSNVLKGTACSSASLI